MIMSINGTTRIVGVIGSPVAHTASPAMHNAAYRALSLNYVYVPLLVAPADLRDGVAAIKTLHFAGINVTIPHKESIISLLDEVDPLAVEIGAVNTVVNQGGRLTGYNTDGNGFILALKAEKGVSPKGKRVTVLGAGGSAKAIAFSLAAEAEHIHIANRSTGRAAELAARLNRVRAGVAAAGPMEGEAFFSVLHQSDIVINTTPLGMAPDTSQCPLNQFDWVRPGQLVCDIIYKPAQTIFMAEAAARGAAVMGGAGMLAGQGILGFELFTGRNVPYDVMRKEI